MASGFVKALLVCFAVCIPESWAKCDAGWLSFSDSCYMIIQNRKTWPAAKTDCEAMGSHLAIVMSEDENNFLKAELRRLHPETQMQFWMDGTDQTTEGMWIWESTGESFEVTDWHVGEPNQNGGEEDCLSLYTRFSFEWNDKQCDKPEGYICEKESLYTVVG